MHRDPASLLRERGIHVTAQRLAVMRVVSAEPHIAADRVAELVRAEIGAISLQSVYDALALLEPGAAVQRRVTAGGAGPASVEEQLVKARATLEEQSRWLARSV